MQKIDLDKFVKDKTLGYFCETALRKKYKPSDMSFDELINSFNTLKENT